MIVTAWNNGAHHQSGAGYGLKLAIEDRDSYFQADWDDVVLELEDYPHPITVNVKKKSFWSPTCRELIKKDIGIWLRRNGLAPWKNGEPPKLEMKAVGNRLFRVRKEPV